MLLVFHAHLGSTFFRFLLTSCPEAWPLLRSSQGQASVSSWSQLGILFGRIQIPLWEHCLIFPWPMPILCPDQFGTSVASPWPWEKITDTELTFSNVFKKSDHTVCSSLSPGVLRVTPACWLLAEYLTCPFVAHLPGRLVSSVWVHRASVFTPLPSLTSSRLICSLELIVSAGTAGKRKAERCSWVPGVRHVIALVCSSRGKLQNQPSFSLSTPLI